MAGLRKFIFAIFCACGPLRSAFGAEPTLRFLSIVHRHGERAPTRTYPLDPYKDDSYWPDGREELLKVGKVNMYEVGKMLRKRYDGFIPDKYKAEDLLARSTATNRAIMSAQLVLAGLYPPKGDQIVSPELTWQPIPVQVLQPVIDDMLCVARACPRNVVDRQKFRAGRYQTIRSENQQTIDYLREHTGLEFKTDGDFSDVYDNLLIEDEQGFKLPEWSKTIYPEKITELYWNTSYAYKKNPTYTKITSGVLIDDLLKHMQKKRDDKTFDRLFNLYSAHDSTIIGLWRGMGITEDEPRPSFGAVMIFELHEIDKKYQIKIWYKNRATVKDLKTVSIKGCTDVKGWCSLDHFLSLLESARVTDYDKECFSAEAPANLPPVEC